MKLLEDASNDQVASQGRASASVQQPRYAKIEVLDATLRDRTFGVSFAVGERLSIASMLDSLGIDFVEYSIPKSSRSPAESDFSTQLQAVLKRGTRAVLQIPHDLHPADAAAAAKLPQPPTMSSPSSTIPKGMALGLRAECWRSHLVEPFTHRRIDPDENLRNLEDRIEALRGSKEEERQPPREIFFSADHFFDGYLEDSVYALAIVRAAAKAGASRVVLCDSRGIATPDLVARAVKLVAGNLASEHPGVLIGICAHNDCGLAVANTLAAISAGARHVQGTINGLGERAGNADLCQLLPLLTLRLGYAALNSPLPRERQLLTLKTLSRKVSEASGVASAAQRPFVGEGAFAHADPSHIAAVSYSPDTYEAINPAFVGNARKMGVDDASLILGEMWELGLYSKEREKVANKVIAKMNELEAHGYKFDDAKASVHLLILDTLEVQIQPFEVLRWETSTVSRVGAQPEVSGTIEVAIHKEGRGSTAGSSKGEGRAEEDEEKGRKTRNIIASAKGVGPIHAVDLALRRALESEFPELKNLKLVSYSLNIVDSLNGTAAAARARTEFADQGPPHVVAATTTGAKREDTSAAEPGEGGSGATTWATTAVSDDVLDASIRALIDGYRYKLIFRSSSSDRFALPDWKVALSWRYSERC